MPGPPVEPRSTASKVAAAPPGRLFTIIKEKGQARGAAFGFGELRKMSGSHVKAALSKQLGRPHVFGSEADGAADRHDIRGPGFALGSLHLVKPVQRPHVQPARVHRGSDRPGAPCRPFSDAASQVRDFLNQVLSTH